MQSRTSGVENARKFDYSGRENIPSGNIEFEAKMIAGIINEQSRLPFFESEFNATNYAQKFGNFFGGSASGSQGEYYQNLINWKNLEIERNSPYGRKPIGNIKPSYFNSLKSYF